MSKNASKIWAGILLTLFILNITIILNDKDTPITYLASILTGISGFWHFINSLKVEK